MGYHGLRVLNDDRVAPGGGFDTHPHRDMEILTWVLDGRLAHRDSMGHASALGPGGLQVMSAGSGVTHSEFNASDAAPVHFLQVWIQPTQTGTEPRYAERSVDPAARDGKLALLAADDPSGDAEAIEIGADARVYVGDFRSGQSAVLQVNPDRVAYVHVATGQLTVNDTPLEAGDAVTLEGVDQVRIEGSVADAAGQLLLFDLPA
jgi:redox-sensitive bicupin YhaK (pirin superfamily)